MLLGRRHSVERSSRDVLLLETLILIRSLLIPKFFFDTMEANPLP